MAGGSRSRQIVVRFSDEEWELVTRCALEAGLAIGAWIGQTAIESADGRPVEVGLPDLLRLHSDVLSLVSHCPTDGSSDDLRVLIRRIDAVVDLVVAELERRPR